MIGIQTDFSIHSGDSRELQFTIIDENGAAVVLTGATPIKWELARAAPGDDAAPMGAALVQKSLGSGVTITDDVTGKLTVVLAPANTEDLAGRHYFELEITVSSQVSTAAFGIVTILKDLIVETTP